MLKIVKKKASYILPLLFLYLLVPSMVRADEIYSSEEEAVKQELTMFEKEMEQPGTYPIHLKFKREGKVVETTIYCTIKGKHTVIVNGVAIDANTISISKEKVKTMTNEDWIRLTNAQAWQTRDGVSLPIEVVDASAITNKIGRYPVTFQTIEQVAITVNVDVVEDLEALYQKNNNNGWYETMGEEEKLSWFPSFNHVILVLIRMTLFILLLVPLLALIIQYLFATKLVRQVIALIKK